MKFPGTYAKLPRKVNQENGNWHQAYDRGIDKRYGAFYYTIKLNKHNETFSIDRMSRVVLSMPNAFAKPSKIIFPAGLVRVSPDKFIVTYGEGDCYCRKYEVSKLDLERLLCNSNTWQKEVDHCMVRAINLPFSSMNWLPMPDSIFNFMMKPSDLVLNVASGKTAPGSKLTVSGERYVLCQAFYLQKGCTAGQSLQACTFHIRPAHAEGVFLSFDVEGEDVKLGLPGQGGGGWFGGYAGGGASSNIHFKLIPQPDDGSVLIKAACKDLYVTAEYHEGGRVYMAKLDPAKKQKFWLVPKSTKKIGDRAGA